MVRKVDRTLSGTKVKLGPSRRKASLHGRAKKLGTVSLWQKWDRHLDFLVAKYAFIP